MDRVLPAPSDGNSRRASWRAVSAFHLSAYGDPTSDTSMVIVFVDFPLTTTCVRIFPYLVHRFTPPVWCSTNESPGCFTLMFGPLSETVRVVMPPPKRSWTQSKARSKESGCRRLCFMIRKASRKYFRSVILAVKTLYENGIKSIRRAMEYFFRLLRTIHQLNPKGKIN